MKELSFPDNSLSKTHTTLGASVHSDGDWRIFEVDLASFSRSVNVFTSIVVEVGIPF